MSPAAQAQAAAANPNLDPGTPMSGAAAPAFRLTNQFGQPVSLSAFRGKVVILAFTDSECTTICPLTTASMVAAKDLLGQAGDQVQLLGIDANPEATSGSNVRAYSQSHGMVNQWDFLTGSRPSSRRPGRPTTSTCRSSRARLITRPRCTSSTPAAASASST